MRIVELAFRLVKLAVVALTVVPERRVRPSTELFKLMVLPEVLMLVPACKEIIGEVVAVTNPLASTAKNLPELGPSRKVWPVVVALVRIEELAFRLVATVKPLGNTERKD